MLRPTTNRNRPCATLRGRVIFTSAQGDASGQIYAPGFFPFRSDNVLTIFMVIGGKNGTNEARLHQNNGRCRCHVRNGWRVAIERLTTPTHDSNANAPR